MIAATVAGNLGRDAEFKNVGSDGVCEFTVASSRKVKGEEQTTWCRCTIWGKRGTALSSYLTKGSAVVCVGELALREYRKKDGTAGASLEMRVADIKLMGGKGGGSGARRDSEPKPSSGGDYDYGADDPDDGIPF